MTRARVPATAVRVRDAARTRAEILDVATAEFAAHGYHGSRVDEIAALTRTTKRMIYYHFGGKKQLYIAVLERAYARIRSAEREVSVDNLDPVTALRRVAEVTFDHHEAHPEFIRLVSIENIHNAEHVKELVTLVDLAGPVISLLDDILERGRAAATVPPRRGRHRRPHDDQRVLCLPGGQPAHLRGYLRPGPGRGVPARPLPVHVRGHDRPLPGRCPVAAAGEVALRRSGAGQLDRRPGAGRLVDPRDDLQ